MAEIRVKAAVENLDRVLALVEGEMERAGCSPKVMSQVDLAVEEVFVNIARYAYSPGEGEAVITCRTAGDPPCLEVRFADWGRPYNPLEREDPDVTLSAEQRQVGGLGILLVKKLMDGVDYQFQAGQNILTLRKDI